MVLVGLATAIGAAIPRPGPDGWVDVAVFGAVGVGLAAVLAATAKETRCMVFGPATEESAIPARAFQCVPLRIRGWQLARLHRTCRRDDRQGGNRRDDRRAATVTRVVERVDSGRLSTAAAGIWSGYVYPTPSQLDLPYVDVEIPVEIGSAPAWKFAPADDSIASGVWAIHIHGMGGTKAGALRGVPVAARLGLTSLVVSYRNDGQAPASVDGRNNLGQSEWRDVEAALAYPIDQGARRIFLFGWSLSGSIALQAAARSKYRRQIVGLILDAPGG